MRSAKSKPPAGCRSRDGALYMTAPLIFASGNEPWLPTPAGFVLSKQVLMTVRFAKSATFDTVAKECGAQKNSSRLPLM